MSFYTTLKTYSWEQARETIYSMSTSDVLQALENKNLSIKDFMALVSPAAAPFLEEMARLSQERTLRRFGKTIQLYIPLYLSNACTNGCLYCGFNHANPLSRQTLTPEQIHEEAAAIREMGFEHILLVTGEHPREAGFEYLKEAVLILREYFRLISIEVQPMDTEEYRKLVDLGLHAVYIYQETYHEERYPHYHPRGRKSNFRYRLETPDRLGQAGIYKTGLGCLLGLEDWRTDSFFTALHLAHLRKQYWRTKYSISFPRLRPHAGSFQPDHPLTDRELVQLICAYRLFDENAELSLSTRESAVFRDHVMQLGITAMSAGSSTEPGGYARKNAALEQFAVNDDRSPARVKQQIIASGYEAVWKDWDTFLQ